MATASYNLVAAFQFVHLLTCDPGMATVWQLCLWLSRFRHGLCMMQCIQTDGCSTAIHDSVPCFADI